MIDLETSVQDEIRYLANAMTSEARKKMFLANSGFASDEQRKAVMAKLGDAASGTKVYTRADNHGTTGGRGGSSGIGPLTVQTTRNAGSGGGYHYTGAGDMVSSWVTSLSPDQMKEEYRNDPDRLKAAIEEQLRMGAYSGIKINGHDPSVMDIINGGIAPNYAAPARVLSSEEAAKANNPLGGATAQAINLDSARFSGMTATQQVQQDITGGTTSTSTGGGSSTTTTTTGGTSTSGGTTTGAGDVGGAIETIDLSGNTGGPTAAEIAAANLSAFQQALGNAHF